MRFWLCLGVGVTICPPHHPQTQGFVERYHRSYTAECLRVERPGTLEEVRTVTTAYRTHYNCERPNQALSCGNRPPPVAFPTLPARPCVPLLVDPDAWLGTIDGRGYVRRVPENGSVKLADLLYYVGVERAGQEVAVRVDAAAREFAVLQAGQEIKLVGVGMLVLRVPYAALLGVLAFFMEFIPIVGVIISGAVCVLLALFQGWLTAVLVLAYFAVVRVIEGGVVGPRVMGKAVGIHPATALLALVAGSELFGFWGALFGAPLAGLLQPIGTAVWREVRGGDAQAVVEQEKQELRAQRAADAGPAPTAQRDEQKP